MYISTLSLTSALYVVGGKIHVPAALPPEKKSIVWEAGWARAPVWMGAENVASIGIRFPDSLARSDSLYRLSYPGLLDIYLFFESLWTRLRFN
jgi:hypothetical protein